MTIRLWILLFVVLISSCNGVCIDSGKKRARIIGEWNVLEIVREIRADTLYVEHISSFQLVFCEDGTGRSIFEPGLVVDFEWLYRCTPEQVVIVEEVEGVVIDYPFYEVEAHNIVENKRKKQLWMYEKEVGGVVDRYEYIWELTREN